MPEPRRYHGLQENPKEVEFMKVSAKMRKNKMNKNRQNASNVVKASTSLTAVSKRLKAHNDLTSRSATFMNDLDSFINTVVCGDSLELCRRLKSNSVDCTVTSPPYFKLRDYGVQNQIGAEASIESYIERLSNVFGEIKRATTDEGTLWLNLGDTYLNGELAGIPWRVAFALKSKGWLLRSDIIWQKPNAMPSSVKNRPTVEHEYLFMFSKARDYFYNADAIREPHVTFSAESKMKGGRNHFGKRGGTPEIGKNNGNHNLHDARWDQYFHPLGRNKRTVWKIATGKFRGAHFAVFPEELVRNCILASTKDGMTVLDPFIGSGTTAVVAKKLNRNYTGFDINSFYVAMAHERLGITSFQSVLALPA